MATKHKDISRNIVFGRKIKPLRQSSFLSTFSFSLHELFLSFCIAIVYIYVLNLTVIVGWPKFKSGIGMVRVYSEYGTMSVDTGVVHPWVSLERNGKGMTMNKN